MFIIRHTYTHTRLERGKRKNLGKHVTKHIKRAVHFPFSHLTAKREHKKTCKIKQMNNNVRFATDLLSTFSKLQSAFRKHLK